jgi:chromosome segregation ATPase
MPGGQLTGAAEWRATFACDDDPAAITGVVLEVGRRLVVDLPPPRRRSRAKADPSLERLHEERLRRQEAEATLAERDGELVSLREEADAALAEREAEVETLRGDSERLTRELAEAREALAAAEQERDRLAGELERVSADLAIRDEELTAAREEVRTANVEAEERLATERAAQTEVREKLATAREEAESTITAEAQETERLRAELKAAREETERTVEAERAETARLREELATQTGVGNGTEAEEAAKRMYERIARELEHERAAARSLRRELDAVQAQTAENRRATSAAAANGVTEDVPAATPAARLAAARRSEVGRAQAHQRAEAARAAAAQRVPHGHRSAAAVWAVRGAALVFVVALLVALLLIVSWVT